MTPSRRWSRRAVLVALTVLEKVSTYPKVSLACFVAAVVLWGIVYSSLHPPPPETAQQAAVRQEAVDVAERRDAACRAISMCLAYGKARQECAVAGNFNLCMNIKLGPQRSSARYQCQEDGTLSQPPLAMPTVAQCALSAVGGYFK